MNEPTTRDFDEAIHKFLTHKYPERRELVERVTAAFRDLQSLKVFTVEVAQNCLENRQMPVQVIQTGMMYGIVLGILMERDRAAQKKRPN